MSTLKSGMVELEVRPSVSERGTCVYAFDVRWSGRSILPARFLGRVTAFGADVIPEGWLHCQGMRDAPLGNALAAVAEVPPGGVQTWTSSPCHYPRLHVVVSRRAPSGGPGEASLGVVIDGTSLDGSIDRKGFVTDDVGLVELTFEIVASVEAIARFGCEINVALLPALASWSRDNRTPLDIALDEPSRPIVTLSGCFPYVLTERARLWAEYTGKSEELANALRRELAELYDEMLDPDLAPDDPEQLTSSDIVFHTFELGVDEYICKPDEVDGRDVLVIDLCSRGEPADGIVMRKPEPT